MKYFTGFLACLCVVVSFFSTPANASVMPPLLVHVSQTTNDSASEVLLDVSVCVPGYGSCVPGHESNNNRIKNQTAKIVVTLTTEGVLHAEGKRRWVIAPVQLDETYRLSTSMSVAGLGFGRVKVHAEALDAAGHKLWGRTRDLFFKKTATGMLHSRSSQLAIEMMELRSRHAHGDINDHQYQRALHNLISGPPPGQTTGSRPFATPAPAAASGVPSATINGTAKYTQRISAGGGGNVFAKAADARPISGALVEFFDDKGGVQTQLATTPTVVKTDSNGHYSATVPGQRSDGSAVQLVVEISSSSPAAIIGPIGVGANHALAYKVSSAPVSLDVPARTVDILVDDTTPKRLAAFSIREGILTAFNYVNSEDTRTGVGAKPAQIYIEYPGDNPDGSYFTATNGAHLNVGLDHGFDWDVYTHEYGHYIQAINGTSDSPGGLHYICRDLTGLNQPKAGRTLTKAQAIRLAWGEAWPTYFGTSLQSASGAGAFGIYGVGDTVYTDTANNFHYNLEDNGGLCAGPGEDNELSVQRLLWDFADQPQDGHDELTYGDTMLWKKLVGGTKPVTLNQFRAEFSNIQPGSPAGYSTGSKLEVQVKQGRLYFDHGIGPAPLQPADGYQSAKPPKFKWETRGAGGPPSYHFNKFKVVFYNKDFSKVVFTSPEIPGAEGSLAPDGKTATWTPTKDEWATITSGDTLLHWAVEGTGDSPGPSTGPYLGLDRTISGLDIAFVIDTTGSMSEDIAGVRAGLDAFIDQLAAKHLPNPPLIEIITFKDYVNRQIVSSDLSQIKSVVDSLSAIGGNDCPESSAEALLAAAHDLPQGRGNGKIIFATDASPHAGYSLTGVESRIRAKGIGITTLLTGDCNPGGGVTGSAAPAAVYVTSYAADVSPRASANGAMNHVMPWQSVTEAVWPSNVICGDRCTPGVGVGPHMSPDIFKLVGDPSLVTPSAIASFFEIANSSSKGDFLFLPQVKDGDLTAYTHAVTNAALGAVLPAVISASPILGYSGSTLDVTVTGGYTNFGPSSTVTFGDGISVNDVTVLSATKLVANVTIAPDAADGLRDVVVTTPLGDGTVETTTGGGQFGVNTTATPLIESLLPAQAARGTTTTVIASGVKTHFDATTTVAVSGSGVSVNSVTAESPTRLRVKLAIADGAELGFHAFSATTGGEIASFGSGLLVVNSIAPPPALPTLTSVTPDSGARGATSLDLTVVGSNTHFAEGSTKASFSGTGITVNSVHVDSATQATVNVSIDPAATLGFRDVLMITGGESAAAVSGFNVVEAPPTLVSVTPPTAQAGATGVKLVITGNNTSFGPDSEVAFSGTGITVKAVSASTANSLSATVSIAPSAATGPRDVTVTTGSKTVTGTGFFAVTAAPPPPKLVSVTPPTAQAGTTGVQIAITGENANFGPDSTVSFSGTGITVKAVSASTANSLSATVSIDSSAAIGLRDVTVTTDGKTVTGAGLFTVTAATPPPDKGGNDDGGGGALALPFLCILCLLTLFSLWRYRDAETGRKDDGHF